MSHFHVQPLAGPTLRRQRTIKVEVLVHCSNKIWLGTLEAWLDPVLHTQIVKFEWSTIQRGQGKTYYAIPPSKGSLRRPRWTCLWQAKDSRPQWCLSLQKRLAKGLGGGSQRHSTLPMQQDRETQQYPLLQRRTRRLSPPRTASAPAPAARPPLAAWRGKRQSWRKHRCTDAERCRGPSGCSSRLVGAAAAAACGVRQHTGGPRCRFNVRSISLKNTKSNS